MAQKKIIFPRTCRLLCGIDEEGFERLCECLHARELHLKNRESFVFENDPCDKIGIVVSGSVRLIRHRMDGGVSVLEDVHENGVFGTTYAFRDASAMDIGAVAVGEATVIVFDTKNITRPCHNVCDAHMQFVRNLLTVMSQKTFQMRQKLRILSQRTIRARLMLLLQIEARKQKSLKFDLSYDRQALADYLCVDRSALSAELSKLRAEGVLAFDKNHFTLLQKE